MNQDPNFKPNEMSTNDLYPIFKEGMIHLVKSAFADKCAITPAVFVGIRKAITDDMMKNDPSVQAQAEMYKKELGISEEDLFTHNINAALIDLKPFFNETGIPALTQLGKDVGYRYAQEAIKQMERINNINDVMFSVFVSEAYINKADMTDTEKNNPGLAEKRVQEHIDQHGGSVKNTPGAKEVVILQFETRLFSEMVTMEFIRQEDDENCITYQEITKVEHLGKSHSPMLGRFSGLLHRRGETVSVN